MAKPSSELRARVLADVPYRDQCPGTQNRVEKDGWWIRGMGTEGITRLSERGR